MKLSLNVSVSIDDILDRLIETVPQPQLLKFVKDLDRRIAEWDFTLKLHKHFAKEKKTYDDEIMDLRRSNDGRLLKDKA